MKNTLLQLAVKHNTDKEWAHNYISEFYEEAFAPYREKNISLLEIGVQNGYSMLMWQEYFTSAKIFGLDVDDKGFIPLENISYIKGDAYTEDIANDFSDDTFDIIIDDGPHSFNSQIEFLLRYTSKLKPGGMIVIEDIQSPVWPIGPDYLRLFETTIKAVEKTNNTEYNTKFVRTAGQAVSDSLLFVVERINK